MALSVLNVLSGIAAAAAGFAGEKVSKNGSIPGMNLASIVPALLGKTGEVGGIAGTLASTALKSGLLNNSKMGNLAGLAGSLLSFGKTKAVNNTGVGGIESLAAMITGASGIENDLASIGSLASSLAGTAKSEKDLTSMASELGKSLSGSSGISFTGGGMALKALDKVIGNDTKGNLFKAILKGLS
jgi:hypothetical protein